MRIKEMVIQIGEMVRYIGEMLRQIGEIVVQRGEIVVDIGELVEQIGEMVLLGELVLLSPHINIPLSSIASLMYKRRQIPLRETINNKCLSSDLDQELYFTTFPSRSNISSLVNQE